MNIDENEIRRLNNILALPAEKQLRSYEEYILNDSEFTKHIAATREILGFTDHNFISDDKAVDWAVERIASTHKVSSAKARILFDEQIEGLKTKYHLSDDWDFYLAVFIVNAAPPVGLAVANQKIAISSISNDGTISISLRKGLRQTDYRDAWSVLAELLGPPDPRRKKPISNGAYNQEVYTLHKLGLSYSKIARRLSPNGAQDYEVDRIKKIVREERRRYSEGIDQVS